MISKSFFFGGGMGGVGGGRVGSAEPVPNKPAIGQLTPVTSTTAAVRISKHSSRGKN